MKSRLFIIYLFVIQFSVNLFAMTVTVTFEDPLVPAALINQVKTDITTTLLKYDNMPDLARGFSNANTYASYAASLRGYQGYDLFAVAVGSLVTIQAPNSDPLFFMKLADQLDTGDVYAGIGGNPVVVEGGVNLSFLIDGLYLSGKFGKYSQGIHKSSFRVDYDSNLYGLLAYYEIYKEKAILSRILVWRGLAFNSGFIYSSNTVSFYKKMDPLAPVTVGSYTAVVDPSVDFVLDTKSVVIPLEIYSSIRLLYILNIGVGGGADYVPYGRTSFSLKSDGPITLTDSGPPVITTGGKLNIDAGTKDVQPNKIRPKLMVNLGFSAGPVFIDIPFTYYFTDNGYAFGLSAGMAW